MPTFLLMDDSANELYFVFWLRQRGYHIFHYRVFITTARATMEVHHFFFSESRFLKFGSLRPLLKNLFGEKNKTAIPGIPYRIKNSMG